MRDIRAGVRSLNLHPLDFLVGRHEFVSHLHHELEGGISLLQRHHGLMNVGILAGHQRLNGLTGPCLRIVDMPDRFFERTQKIGPSCLAGLPSLLEPGRFDRLDEIGTRDVQIGHDYLPFTGAIQKKLGKFEMAHTGTLFLDEISEMNLGLQSKLLRVLQEREVDRIGGRDPVPVNIRVIATTNRSLYHEVTQGRFREDLFYRLNVFPVTVPPLRERPGDIPLLARHFLRSSAQRNGLTVPTLPERAIADLQQRAWKGNVRELENVMERAILVTTGNAVDVDHLMPGDGTVPIQPVETVETLVAPSAHGSLWEMERDLIFKTLARVKENRTHAAKELGISIRTLRNK